MQYKVVPFVAKIASDGGSVQAAKSLQELINAEAQDGWSYMHMDNINTHIAGNNGCFGFGATQPSTASYAVVVFNK